MWRAGTKLLVAEAPIVPLQSASQAFNRIRAHSLTDRICFDGGGRSGVHDIFLQVLVSKKEAIRVMRCKRAFLCVMIMQKKCDEMHITLCNKDSAEVTRYGFDEKTRCGRR